MPGQRLRVSWKVGEVQPQCPRMLEYQQLASFWMPLVGQSAAHTPSGASYTARGRAETGWLTLSYYCDQISEKKQQREGRVHLGPQFKKQYSSSWQRRHGGRNRRQLVTLRLQSRSRERWGLSPVHILLSVQPGSKLWGGMILSLFRTSQLDLSRNIVMDVPVTLAFLAAATLILTWNDCNN